MRPLPFQYGYHACASSSVDACHPHLCFFGKEHRPSTQSPDKNPRATEMPKLRYRMGVRCIIHSHRHVGLLYSIGTSMYVLLYTAHNRHSKSEGSCGLFRRTTSARSWATTCPLLRTISCYLRPPPLPWPHSALCISTHVDRFSVSSRARSGPIPVVPWRFRGVPSVV